MNETAQRMKTKYDNIYGDTDAQFEFTTMFHKIMTIRQRLRETPEAGVPCNNSGPH